MPITITNIERPTGCGHMIVTVDVDGVSKQVHAHLDDVDKAVEAAGIPEGALLTLLWIWYRRKVVGESFASMVGKTVA